MAEVWTADRRLYLDKDGKVVEADDPNRTELLAAEGVEVPAARARELGLTQDPAQPTPDAEAEDVKTRQAEREKRKEQAEAENPPPSPTGIVDEAKGEKPDASADTPDEKAAQQARSRR